MAVRASDEKSSMVSLLFQGPRNIDVIEALLESGWRIDPPVLTRLSWTQRTGNERAYHFIMARDNHRRLVVIDDSPEIRRFLERHSLAGEGAA